MSERGYGYYPEEGGLYTAGLLTGGGSYKAGLLTGGGLRSFREGKQRYPSLVWGIKKLQNMERMKKIREKEEEKERKGKKTWRQVFNDYVIPAIKQAKEEYKRNLTGPELEAYRKREQERERRKKQKAEDMRLVDITFNDYLKDENSIERTKKNVSDALAQEGVYNDKIFRRIMGYLFPNLKTTMDERTEKPLLQTMKMEVSERVPKRKQGSYIYKLIEEQKKKSKEEQRGNITNRPPKEQIPEASTKPKQKPKRQTVEEEEFEEVKEPKSPREGTKRKKAEPKGSGLVRLRTK